MTRWQETRTQLFTLSSIYDIRNVALILNVMGRQKECEQFDQKARELYVTLEQSVSLKKR